MTHKYKNAFHSVVSHKNEIRFLQILGKECSVIFHSTYLKILYKLCFSHLSYKSVLLKAKYHLIEKLLCYMVVY